MKGLQWLGLALVLALMGAVTIFAVRVARHDRGLRVEVGRVAVTRLEDETLERLEGLRDKVFLTYYVSARDKMPSHLRRLEREVTAFLESLKAAAPDKVDYQIVDPETDVDLENYASKRRVSPFRVRHVVGDSYSERTIWSALTIAYGAHAPAEINGVTLEHLPRLQALFVEELRQMERPRQPVVGLAPAEGFYELHEALSEYARVVRLDLDGGEAIPGEIDALFWVDPVTVTPARLRELDLFFESGRSAVVAGAEQRAELVADPGGAGPALRLVPTGYPFEALLGEFGLRPVRELACDGFSQTVTVGEVELEAPFQVRCIAPNQDFYNLKNQPNGHLLFTAPTTFAIDDARLAQRAWSAQILATTSDKTWTQPLPREPLPLAAIAPEYGEPSAKLPLMVLLRPDDPWQGMLFAMASSTAFQDGMFRREGVAHWRLLRTLTDNLFSHERMVLNRVNVHRPEPLPELPAGSRLLWWAACLLPLPALLWLLGIRRTGILSRVARGRSAGRPVLLRGLALGLGGFALLVLADRATDWIGLRADLTEDQLGLLSPESRAIAAEARDVRVELFFSRRRSLPPEMRQPVGRVRDRLREFQRAGAELEIEAPVVEDLADAEREELAAAGIEATAVTSRHEGVTTVRNVYASVRLSAGGRSELLHFPNAQAFDSLEFRLAFALWRLQTGRTIRIGVTPDVPRPSSAEAYEHYQMQGLFSPMGYNVNSLAMDFLEASGFELEFIPPRVPPPEMPGGLDMYLWIQPRRPVQKLMDNCTEYLYSGGKVLLAAQHFRIQSRQYRGTQFKIVYWPQPQSPDVEQYYFPDLGLNMVRTVLFDDLHTRMEQVSQISGRGSARTYETREISMPFLIRAAASNFDPDSPITRNVGDQGYIWGNYLELDPERLAELGLRHEVLMTTSPRT